MLGIGYGNNMSYRAEAFTKLGLFKEWLSIGSLGKSAEDAEFALRALIKEQKLFFNPQVMIYHNRWLSKAEMKKQNLNYMGGETACYGYFAFLGYKFASQVVIAAFSSSFHQFKLIVKSILKIEFNKSFFVDLYDFFNQFFARLRGLLIGFVYSFFDRID